MGIKTREGCASEQTNSLAGPVALAVVLFILSATLFPFDFSIRLTAGTRHGFFLFWPHLVGKRWLGWLLNLLFFMPFGFATLWWAQVGNRRLLSHWARVALAGCVLSALVEYLQLFVPQRGSSWDDVLMNTLGAIVGSLIYRFWGQTLLRFTESAMLDLRAIFER
jgi:glycopeptide antibiotics resistance protein